MVSTRPPGGALPHASFVGFTGPPIDKTGADTRAVFGDYISVYDIQRAVADGATVSIYYESRLAPARARRGRAAAHRPRNKEELADHLGCDVKAINRLVNGRATVTAEMPLKLGASFRTTPGFWLNAQKAVDFHRASLRAEELPEPLVKTG